MIGSGDPTPFDFPLLALFAIVAIALIAGAIAGPAWGIGMATWLRRSGALVAIAALAAVLVLTPTRTGSVGAGRIITIFPAFALVMIIFLACSWRAGRV